MQKDFELIFGNITKKFKAEPEDSSDLTFDKVNFPEKSEVKLRYKDKKETIEAKFNDVDKLKNYLIKNQLLFKIESQNIFQKFRLDFWRLVDNKLCPLECKNKEKTFLEKRDINQVASYGKLIKESIPLGYITLVLNGHTKNWDEKLAKIERAYGIEIRIHNIKKWLVKFAQIKGIKIDYLVFSKHPLHENNFIDLRAGKNSKLYLNIHTSPYDPLEPYKPIELLISDDSKRIEGFLERKTKKERLLKEIY